MKTIVEIKFGGHLVPRGDADSILGPSQCGPDVAKRKEYTWEDFGGVERPGVDVEITLDDKDPRVQKVLDLLAEHGNEPWVDREDIYTEDELQAAPLLVFTLWYPRTSGGPGFGTTYDMSKACPRCGTGARQTSPLIVDPVRLKAIEKLRIAGTSYGEVLVHDVDVEPLVAAGVTGALFWPAYAKTKAGDLEELRRQQMFVEHVMPPMSPNTLLNRTQLCPHCRRGCFTYVLRYPFRVVYRREDLANIQDVNVTWEWFGDYLNSPGEPVTDRWPNPHMLVTPKVMNLLRGKTKKEQKYQGCEFTPIWIDDETHEQPYLQT